MKPVKLFHFESCPYCRDAKKWMKELQEEYPELAKVKVELIDEKLQPDVVDAFLKEGHSYYYVPTFFVDGIKAHEGAASKDIVEKVLRSALG